MERVLQKVSPLGKEIKVEVIERFNVGVALKELTQMVPPSPHFAISCVITVII